MNQSVMIGWSVVSMAVALAGCAADTTALAAEELSGGGGVGTTPGTGSPGPYLPNPCLTGEPDDLANIPQSGSASTTSGDGSYAYDDNGCSYYVADFRQYVYSNAYWNGSQWINWEVHSHAGAYDLPSSAGFAGTMPTNAYDCGQLRVYVRHHRRHSYDSAFPSSPDYTANGYGVWSGSSCSLAGMGAGHIESSAPSSGVYIHRWLVRVMLRGTAQQAGAWVYPAPPE